MKQRNRATKENMHLSLSWYTRRSERAGINREAALGFRRSKFANSDAEKKDAQESTKREYAPLAQLVEQLTLNQWVPGSNP